MRFPRFITLLLVLSIAPFVLAACGDDEEPTGNTGGDTTAEGGGGGSVNIYSSLPLQGASEAQTKALVQGIELALEQAGNKAGNISVKYQSLDDSTAQAGTWTPEATSANARKVAQDDKAVAYIGEFNSGASAISMPILNEAQVPQVLPGEHRRRSDHERAWGRQGRAGEVLPGGPRASPLPAHRAEGHDPGRGSRDDHEGRRLQERRDGQRQGGLRRRLGAQHRGLARGAGRRARVQRGHRPEGLQPVACRAPSRRTDCFVFSGITANGSVQIFKDSPRRCRTPSCTWAGRRRRVGLRRSGEGGIPPTSASASR